MDLYRFYAGLLSVYRSQQETDEMTIHSEEFKRAAVRIALTSGLRRPRVASDLARENERLRLENRVLREEREVRKKATQFFASQRP